MSGAAWRCVRGTLLGLALFAVTADGWLLDGHTVARWWLPACLALGLVFGGLGMPPAAPVSDRPPRWLFATTLTLVALIAAMLGFGAVATPARHWDGVVTWGLKAAALTAQTTLAQPLFADPEVLHHSASYPLLQPLCLAALGQWWGAAPARLFFPLVYLLLVSVIAAAVSRRTGSTRWACWAALGVALVPELIGVGAGSVDSGYADALHALGLGAAAAALLLGDVVLLAAAAATLPFIKPEGMVHAGLLATVALALAPFRAALAAVLGVVGAASVAIPLSARLAHAPPPGALAQVAPWLAAATALALRAGLTRVGARARCGIVAVILAAAATALVLLQTRLATSGQVLFAQYLGRLDRVADKLPETGAILLGLAQSALSPRQFGGTFAGVCVVLLALRCRRPWPQGARAVAWFVGVAALAVVSAFYLSPEADVAHHLRSSASRLLLQLVGPAWLLSVVLLASVAPGDWPPRLRRLLGIAAAAEQPSP